MIKQRKPLIEEYEINPCTMMIMPIEYGSKLYSRIFEIDEEYISPFKPIEIIKKSCIYFGASYEGRKEATKTLIGITHKVPIAISSHNFINFFPTTSPNNPECMWISYEHVVFHEKADSKHTNVTFSNKNIYTLPVSFNSFENQLLRTALLKTKTMQRMEETERKAMYYFHGPRYFESSERNGEYGRYMNRKN
ncbi:competence transcription factor [Bacillus methanolicus PB1]|uniref:Competence transcription factor n=1 Tax=Bacillus methanolicus PB1 TaxID=997296 RepID=I3E600_BACMT|nr:competence protein ComK [Bacillus methanolicus]EIJ81921.1 competence transcription factor [Bacillus methanolicus PB1]